MKTKPRPFDYKWMIINAAMMSLLPIFYASVVIFLSFPLISLQNDTVRMFYMELYLPVFLMYFVLGNHVFFIIYLTFVATLTGAAYYFLYQEYKNKIFFQKKIYYIAFCIFIILVLLVQLQYKPSFKFHPGVEYNLVEAPNMITGVSRSFMIAGELPNGFEYTIAGWKDSSTLIYQKWQRHIPEGDYNFQSSDLISTHAYDIRSETSVPYGGSLTSLQKNTCDITSCLKSYGEHRYLTSDKDEAFISPDKRNVAFISRYMYGPHDIVIIKIK